MAEILHKLIG